MAVVEVLQSSTGVWVESWSQQKNLFQCENMAVVQILHSSTGAWSKPWSHEKILFQCDNMALDEVLQSSTRLWSKCRGFIKKFCYSATIWL